MTKSTWNPGEQLYANWLATLPANAVVTATMAPRDGHFPRAASAEWDDAPDWATCRAVIDKDGDIWTRTEMDTWNCGGAEGYDAGTVADGYGPILPLLDGEGRTILTGDEVDAVARVAAAHLRTHGSLNGNDVAAILRDMHGWPRP